MWKIPESCWNMKFLLTSANTRRKQPTFLIPNYVNWVILHSQVHYFWLVRQLNSFIYFLPIFISCQTLAILFVPFVLRTSTVRENNKRTVRFCGVEKRRTYYGWETKYFASDKRSSVRESGFRIFVFLLRIYSKSVKRINFGSVEAILRGGEQTDGSWIPSKSIGCSFETTMFICLEIKLVLVLPSGIVNFSDRSFLLKCFQNKCHSVWNCRLLNTTFRSIESIIRNFINFAS